MTDLAASYAYPMVARGLIRDASGRWLIVLPREDPRWLLPGGVVAAAESPRTACHRRIGEQLGIAITPQYLLSLRKWTPLPPTPAAGLCFLFDMGSHPAEVVSRLICDAVPFGTTAAQELDGWRWEAPDEALALLHPDLAVQLTAALAHSLTPAEPASPTRPPPGPGVGNGVVSGGVWGR